MKGKKYEVEKSNKKVVIAVVVILIVAGALFLKNSKNKNNENASAVQSTGSVSETSKSQSIEDVTDETDSEKTITSEKATSNEVSKSHGNTTKASAKSTSTQKAKPKTTVPKWKTVYKGIVTRETANFEFIPESFALIKLDNDDIPELILSGGNSHIDVVRVYSYSDGRAIYCGEYGSYGTIAYSGNKIIGVLTSGAGGEIQSIVVDRIVYGSSEPVFNGKQECASGVPNEFFIDGEKVSIEEFREAYNQSVPDSVKYIGSEYPPCVEVFSDAFGCKEVKCTKSAEKLYKITDKNVETVFGK